MSVSFSPQGSRIASGSGEDGEPGEIRLWDARTGKEFPPEEELAFRKAMGRPDPIWHRERLAEFTKSKNTFAATVQNYLLHQATAEEHFDYNRFDQAFYWYVATQALKPKPPVIDGPELLPRPKEMKD